METTTQIARVYMRLYNRIYARYHTPGDMFGGMDTHTISPGCVDALRKLWTMGVEAQKRERRYQI